MADHAGKKSSHSSSHKPNRNAVAWTDRRAPRNTIFIDQPKNTKPKVIVSNK